MLLGDDVIDSRVPCLKQMLDVYGKFGGSILGVQEVRLEDTRKYGIVRPEHVDDNLFKVEDLVEKPEPAEAPSTLAVLGRYIIQPEVFDFLEKQEPGAGGEIQLTDALRLLAGEQSIYAYVFEGRRCDVGDGLGFLQATVEFALKREDLKKEELAKSIILLSPVFNAGKMDLLANTRS